MSQVESATTRTHYETLGLDTHCSSELIKTRYRELAREYHPDQLGHLSDADIDDADRKMASINEAYRVLSDPAERLIYDQTLRAAWTAQQRQAEPIHTTPARPPIFAWVLIGLTLGGVVAIWFDSAREDRRGFNEQFAPVAPLVTPYVQEGKTQPGPSVKELLQSPQGELMRRALQSEMTPESCLRAFPEHLQLRSASD